MLKKVLVALVVVVAAAVALVATRPSSYRVERTAVVAAPASAVYAQIADFERWKAWSPWAGLDPAMKTECSGPPGTVGHAYHWSGNDKVGEGRMTLTGATPGEHLAIRLEFLKPFAAVASNEFALAPDGGGTRVAWIMTGENGFVQKAMSLFMSMEKAIGGDFEKGLAALRTVAEAEAGKAAAAAVAPAPAPRK